MVSTERPILFHYPASIYSHRVLWYLWLRDIPYDECIQPSVMPRPDLASIDVGYRKMPVLAIGKDVYCDSRLIISKLEALFPNSSLAPLSAPQEGVRRLFENWTIDGGIFTHTVKLMPYWLETSLLQSKSFLDDRQILMGGRRMTAQTMEAGRPDGLQHLRQAIDLLENTFLADGREWVLGTEKPSVADIDAVWPFEWLIVDKGMRGSLPSEHFSEDKYPKVYAWVIRFMAEVEKKKNQRAGRPISLDGSSMKESLLNATSMAEHVDFDGNDPLKLALGDEVEVFPSDYGQMGKTNGAVIGLTTHEVVIRNKLGLHVHFPRWNFRIKKTAALSQLHRPITPAHRLPKMRLIYHPFSPFSRKVFALAIELDLAKSITLQKVVVCPVPIAGWSDNNADVAVYNPMAKIPCLIPDGVSDGIFDSRMICEYLSDLALVKVKKDTRYWRLRTLHAAADGIMDAAVLISYEVRIRKEKGIYFEEWVDGQKQKIIRVLNRFEVALKEGLLSNLGSAPASMDEIAIAVAIATTSQMGYLGIDWRKDRPKLVQWMNDWQQRDSFVKTPPTKDWTVEETTKNPSKI
ncbi:hypothetical protein ACN47E_000572 [Coniothyrium glycines]